MSDRPRPNKTVPQIQEPVADLGSLVTVAKSLKVAVDVLAGLRGGPYDRAVTFADLRDLGLFGQLASQSQTLAEVPRMFADLPAAPLLGQQFIVSDATVDTWGSVISIGGGLLQVRVWWNGTNWTVIAK